MTPSYPYIHLERANDPFRRVMLGMVITLLFLAGFFVGGIVEYSNGKRAGVNEVESAIIASIRQGEQFAFSGGTVLIIESKVNRMTKADLQRIKERADHYESINEPMIRYRAMSFYGDDNI